jgi:hypothetical protein
MPHEPVRTGLDEMMTSFCLNSHNGRKEWINDHGPGLKRTTEQECSKGQVADGRGYVEAWAAVPNGEASNGQGKQEE